MKVAYLGTGAWGFALATLLASKGYKVTCWSIDTPTLEILKRGEEHPFLPGHRPLKGMHFTNSLEEAVRDADLIVESVTTKGIRPVFTQLKKIGCPGCPIVVTSKGIEQDTHLILPEVIVQTLGEEHRHQVGAISGPSYAIEVIKGLPTSVVATAFDPAAMQRIAEAFTTPTFRVYPNPDIKGVAFGGALKNVIAIACGISDGLGLGSSSKAALITRGLHEIRKIAIAEGCQVETLYGLSGMGDLTLTCSSDKSRNNRFGALLAQGIGVEEATKQIRMVVEGVYSCTSAMQLGRKHKIPLPITECVDKIMRQELSPDQAVRELMQRSVKEEHL